MTQVLTRNDSSGCGTWKDPNCYFCSEYVERAPDPDTVKFHFCDKDGLGSMGLGDLINLIATHDSDGEGLSDLSELLIHNTDPLNPDTDGGGVNDGDEVAGGGDPLDAADDSCLAVKVTADLTIPPAGNISDPFRAWSTANGIATLFIPPAGNVSTGFYAIPATETCPANDTDFILITPAGNPATGFYVLKGV